MGGEKFGNTALFVSKWGSPPHGRGKDTIVIIEVAVSGITPAWAGKSIIIRYIRAHPWDHPRMGGEKPIVRSGGCLLWGSPPHGRGKADVCSTLEVALGITPAWAGKSCPERLKTPSARDHPRMGGEKWFMVFWFIALLGSPPHGRGKAAAKGKESTAKGDHPRMGGEKCRGAPAATLPPGSPPHGRGKALYPDRARQLQRITPAWAGKS